MMKGISTFLLMICLMAVSHTVSAKSDKELHEEARYLADKIAYEMQLNKDQMTDVYEINYDFLKVAYPLFDRIAAGDEQAITQYYIYLDDRNADLVWVIPGKQYTRFMDMDALFRPLYLKDGKAHLRAREVYGNKYYEKRRIKKFGKYKGEHSRAVQEDNSSYYRGQHRIVAYGGQSRLLHGSNKRKLIRAIGVDFGK